MPNSAKATLAVFASDKGPGDAERASIMSQAGTYLARKGARIVCLAEKGVLPVPLITSARAAGGEITVIGDETIVLPTALSSVPLETISDARERMRRVAVLAQGFVGLPGSLASASSLYATWVEAGGGEGRKPVVLYNRNNAFEIMRGYAADVLSHSIKGHDRIIQFADSIEDLWNRIARMVPELRG